jgi:hypothetical protein
VKLFSAMALACCLLSGCDSRTPTPKPGELVGTWVASDGGRIQLTNDNQFVAEGIPECILWRPPDSRKRVSCKGSWQLHRFSEDSTPVVKFIVESRDGGERRSSFDLLTQKTAWDWSLVGYLTSVDAGDAYAFEREGGK